MSDQPALTKASAQHHSWAVDEGEAGERLDRYLASRLPELSRARVQQLVDEGRARVNGISRKRSHRVTAGETISIDLPAAPPREVRPEAAPLEVLYEDEDVAVVNKPAGIVVHPGAGATVDTLANALLHHFGNLSGAGGALRPGIVHRLDKGTSGALLVARNDAAHRSLAEQFQARQIEKTYVALLHGQMRGDSGRIELPVARDLRHRTRMTARRREGRPARTDWRVRLRLDGFTLLEADLHTGRTHQLRVHFSALGHPVVGDTLYGAPREARAGKETLAPLGRNFLHAARVRFMHPRHETSVEVRAPLPAELAEYLQGLARAAGAEPGVVDAVLSDYL